MHIHRTLKEKVQYEMMKIFDKYETSITLVINFSILLIIFLVSY